MSGSDCDGQHRSGSSSPTERQQRLATVLRYRAQALDLRRLANLHRSTMMRRRLVEIAAEFDQLADALERGTP